MSRSGLNFVKRRALRPLLAVLLAAAAAYWPAANAQNGVPDGAAQDPATLVGPIALYPDDLVAVVLPASTYPVQIVEAARFLDRHEKNPSLQPDPSWDDTVVALLNYPEVLRMMSANLNWTTSLGQAVLDSQAQVMDAIQAFRDRAYAAGNLRSDEHQSVSRDADGAIEIQPTDPSVVYIPYYQPERAVVYETVPVLHYYAHPFPLYYYPYPAGYAFSINFFWGVTSAFSISWGTHLLDYCAPTYRGHPYYGRRYYAPYYVRRDRDRGDFRIAAREHVWHSERHRAAGPERRGRYAGRRPDGDRKRPDRNRLAFAGTRDRTAAARQYTRAPAATSARRGGSHFASRLGAGGTVHLNRGSARRPQTHALQTRSARKALARRGAVRREQPPHRPSMHPAARSAPARTRPREAAAVRSSGGSRQAAQRVQGGRSRASHALAQRAEGRAAKTHGRRGGRRTQRR